MSTLSAKLTPKQQRTLVFLLSEPTLEAAASKAGVGYSTLRKWLAEAPFKQALQTARRELTEAAMNRLQAASTEAVNVLVGLMNSSATPATVRLGAAGKVLEMAVKSLEFQEIEARLSALESQITGNI